MLSTITPMGEASRGNRFRTTATWFILGATLGGAVLGLGGAVLAAIVHALGISETARARRRGRALHRRGGR